MLPVSASIGNVLVQQSCPISIAFLEILQIFRERCVWTSLVNECCSLGNSKGHVVKSVQEPLCIIFIEILMKLLMKEVHSNFFIHWIHHDNVSGVSCYPKGYFPLPRGNTDGSFLG